MMNTYAISNTAPVSTIVSKFPALKRQKSARLDKDITLRDIAKDTGLSLGTIHKLSTGRIDGVKLETIAKLCDYFEVGVGDIIEYRAD